MNKENSRGARSDPCGTPDVMLTSSEGIVDSNTMTYWKASCFRKTIMSRIAYHNTTKFTG